MVGTPGRQAARGACVYCRDKKLKCDRGQPACKSCLDRAQQCVYVARTRSARPTNSRISQLQLENEALRLAAERNRVDQQQLPPLSPSLNIAESNHATHPTHGTALSPVRAENPEPDSPRVATANPLERTAFAHINHEGSPWPVEQRRLPSTTNTGLVEDRRVLYGQTARQRHLEKHILTSADLDGVEPSLAMDLLSHYWDRQLHAGLIVYRTVFMRDLAAGGGTFFSKLLLNALFFSASKHVPESWEDSSDPASSGSRYRKRFFELLEGERYRCSITTIQGLLIVANTLFSRCDERSLSWLLTGNAFQMLVHMRLHLDDLSESPDFREVRRRLYWGAYVLDKVQSLYQGRPPYLRVLESNVPMTFVDDFEEFEPFHGESFSCLSGQTVPILCHHISQLQMYASLCVVMERIHVRMYRMRDLDSADGSTVHTDINNLWQDLRQWRAGVPTHLSAFTSSQNEEEPPLPNAVAILALYNVLTIQLWQWQISSPLTARSLTIDTHNLVPGLSAAKEICHLIHTSAQYYTPASATFTLSYAAHIAATVLVRIMTQDSTAFSEMKDYLQLCLEFLRMQTHLYYSSRRSLKVLETMIERAGIIFSEGEDSEAMALENSSSRIRITSPVTGADQGAMASSAGFSFDAAGMVFDPIAFSLEDLDSWSRTFHAEQSDIDIEGTVPMFG